MPSPAALDISALDAQDRLNVVLQRSDVLGYSRESHDMVRAWEAGDAAPLERAVAANGDAYVRDAARIILDEFNSLRGLLERLPHARLADIGCGYGLFDLFAYHALGCDLLLIDIERTEIRQFGYREEGSGYSSLETARALLADNGVPESSIQTWNPSRQDMPEGAPIDIAVSFLSCGFHYPVDMYLPFFGMAVQPRGAVILDLRGTKAPEIIAQLSALGSVRVLNATAGVKRVLLRKWGKA